MGPAKMLLQFVFCCLVSVIAGGLLGAGKGEGNCPASPYRTEEADLKYTEGCPEWPSAAQSMATASPSRLGRRSCSGTVMGRATAWSYLKKPKPQNLKRPTVDIDM